MFVATQIIQPWKPSSPVESCGLDYHGAPGHRHHSHPVSSRQPRTILPQSGSMGVLQGQGSPFRFASAYVRGFRTNVSAFKYSTGWQGGHTLAHPWPWAWSLPEFMCFCAFYPVYSVFHPITAGCNLDRPPFNAITSFSILVTTLQYIYHPGWTMLCI